MTVAVPRTRAVASRTDTWAVLVAVQRGAQPDPGGLGQAIGFLAVRAQKRQAGGTPGYGGTCMQTNRRQAGIAERRKGGGEGKGLVDMRDSCLFLTGGDSIAGGFMMCTEGFGMWLSAD